MKSIDFFLILGMAYQKLFKSQDLQAYVSNEFHHLGIFKFRSITKARMLVMVRNGEAFRSFLI